MILELVKCDQMNKMIVACTSIRAIPSDVVIAQTTIEVGETTKRMVATGEYGEKKTANLATRIGVVGSIEGSVAQDAAEEPGTIEELGRGTMIETLEMNGMSSSLLPSMILTNIQRGPRNQDCNPRLER